MPINVTVTKKTRKDNKIISIYMSSLKMKWEYTMHVRYV